MKELFDFLAWTRQIYQAFLGQNNIDRHDRPMTVPIKLVN
jgi:hypothetical protein